MKKFAKKLIAIILVFSIISAVFVCSLLQVSVQSGIAISLESKTVGQGESFDIDIKINANSGITLMRLYIEYDSSVLTLINVKDKGVLGEFTVSDNLNSPLCMVWLDGVNNYGNTGTVATLTFKASQELSEDIIKTAVKISTKSKNDILNEELESVIPQLDDGNITVLSSAVKLGKTTCQPGYEGYNGIWLAEKYGTFMLVMENDACVNGWEYAINCNDYTYSSSTANGQANKNICYKTYKKLLHYFHQV